MTADNVTYFVILNFISSERNQLSPHPSHPPTDTYTQQQTNFLEAHESLGNQ
jgi:hypothetical protein